MLHAEAVQPEPATDSTERAHRLLASANARRFAPRRTAGDFDAGLEHEAAMRRTERAFVEAERAAVKAEARAVPTDPEAFVAWFESLPETHCTATRALSAWLSSEATPEQTQWLNAVERAQDMRFNDWLALTRVNMPEPSKLELARHWSALTHGGPSPLFEQRPAMPTPPAPQSAIWEALAVDNLMVALATAPHYVYQALGALGTVEHTDVVHRHATHWTRELLAPLVSHDSSLAPLIAEGALMRLRLVARRDERYLEQLNRSSASVAQFEYAEDPSVAPVAQSVPPAAPGIRPVQWRDVSARQPY